MRSRTTRAINVRQSDPSSHTEGASRRSLPRTGLTVAVSVASALLLAVSLAAPSAGADTPAATGVAGAASATLPHNTCRLSAIDVPSCGVLWGMFMPSQAYGTVESKIGRRLDMVKDYVPWQPGRTFPNATARNLAAGGRILEYSWTASSFKTRAKVSYRSIANGSWDKSVILPEARAIKSFGKKVIIDFQHEMDFRTNFGRGTPAQYVAAYRHIHRVFSQAGVRNVIWAWVTTGIPGHEAAIKSYYPGAAYVNWIGYDPYNFASCHRVGWHLPYNTFAPFYQWLRSQPKMRNKPFMLGEYASAHGPLVQSWYAGVASALSRLPQIKAVMQFDNSPSAGCSFNLNSSAAALAGFKASSHSAYILGH
jgi:Glycosyl hydrolase family 26